MTPSEWHLRREERKRIRRCQVVTRLAPLVAGFACGGAYVLARDFGHWSEMPARLLYYATVFATGCVTACTVAVLHPVQRDKWKRIGWAFVFGAAGTSLAAALALFLLSVVSAVFIRR